MEKNQIETLVENCTLPDRCQQMELKETHISWLVLTDRYAFKIKRPVQFSFLDFSSLEQRRFFCQEEVRLNKRLAPDMYLDVIPITSKMVDQDSESDEIIDYAVKMKRMDNTLEMDALLKQGKVTGEHVDRLAKKISRFHHNESPIKNAFRVLEFQENYKDIQSVADFAAKEVGPEAEGTINRCIKQSFDYLNDSRSFLNERIISGFQRDCHGDLNSRNIFLYDDPVIFDCIEFNKYFRQIDVLNDIAFLAVELDFFDRKDLADLFYSKYLFYFEMNDDPLTRRLFNYYKSYRANVRAKVALLEAKKKPSENHSELTEASKYLELMSSYLDEPS